MVAAETAMIAADCVTSTHTYSNFKHATTRAMARTDAVDDSNNPVMMRYIPLVAVHSNMYSRMRP